LSLEWAWGLLHQFGEQVLDSFRLEASAGDDFFSSVPDFDGFEVREDALARAGFREEGYGRLHLPVETRAQSHIEDGAGSMAPDYAEYSAGRVTGVILAVGARQSPLQISCGEDGGAAPEAAHFVLMVIDDDGRSSLVRQLPHRTKNGGHLIADVLTTTVQFSQRVEDHNLWLELRDHVVQPLHPNRILKLEPVTGGFVEGQNVKGSITAVPNALCNAHADIADVLLRRAVDRRPLLDGPIKEGLSERHGGTQVEGQQPFGRLFTSVEETKRCCREYAVHDVLEVGQLKGEQLV
jgi:hypothetical protein